MSTYTSHIHISLTVFSDLFGLDYFSCTSTNKSLRQTRSSVKSDETVKENKDSCVIETKIACYEIKMYYRLDDILKLLSYLIGVLEVYVQIALEG